MVSKNKLTKEQIKIIINEYNGGIFVKDISKKFNVGRNSIYYQLKKHNISTSQRKSLIKYKHDIIGKTFGYLTILRIERNDNSTKFSPYRAVCKCNKCGNICDVAPVNILRGSTTSCGCRRDQYKKNSGKNNKQFTGYEGISGKYWGLIKKRAKRRGYEINITIQYAWELYLKQNKKCALTGLPIEFSNKNKENSVSLDRIDSKKGYIKGNIQWVHKDINIMKNIYDQDYFISICKLITKNNMNHEENYISSW